ncbi:MAG: FAD-binding oxidoreductase [Spirochaetales bacterium]|uniref:FAD-binding oxidoreductase n=1 Tax=Candidatus Thalassospirochaeta sargassi TaxID=3119039 RepID=A0AAJ1MK47_9SPIO|nr:FAD-binding oxidoreductase [Spirochaetales bacterium]
MIKDKRTTLPIARIVEETENVRTFTFRMDVKAAPGQFIMLTDFKGGEKPFSISDNMLEDGKNGYLSVSIKRIGDFTRRLFDMKAGDIVSIRGPYGTPFFIPGKPDEKTPEVVSKIKPADFRPVLCGGGFGLPPLYLLAKRLLEAGVPAKNIKAVGAGRSEADLLFEQQFTGLGIPYTGAAESLDDVSAAASLEGGCGRICGTAAEALTEIATETNFVYASGPDLMMKSLIPQMPQDTEYQFLFERYMKCAIGICGSCATDPGGIRICKEGPALWRHQVEQLEDFGVYRRTASGAIELFENRLAGRDRA